MAMPETIGGPRVLLRRLREVMAASQGSQERLDEIVRVIAANMVAEVCSVYILRPDQILELVATEGLNPDSVHATTLQLGEGLVGMIASTARPLSLSSAKDHPAFVYKPETGEDPYHSLLGVPILRGGHVLGVLLVQNRLEREYDEEELEALQTTSMVVAELLVSDQLVNLAALHEAELERDVPQKMEGVALAEGIALGHAALHEPRVHVTHLIADNMYVERERLDGAIRDLRRSIDSLLSSADLALAGEHRDVLEAYRMFAHDEGWLRRLREAVMTGLTAEAAVERVQSDTRARMLRQTDRYLRERLHDLDDLANRLLRLLTGDGSLSAELPKDAIIIARSMGPAELLDYDRKRLRGVILEEGSPTAHVAIVARALGVAVVGRVRGILDWAEHGDPIIVDGDSGEVFIHPKQEVITAYSEKARFRARRQRQYRAIRKKPAVTKDGQNIAINMNAGLLVDLPHLQESGASGIGLFRTELQFMISATLPRQKEQIELYSQVLDAAEDRSVVFRTLDIGGDKVVPYLSVVKEDNPAMGWRSIRLALDRPALLRYQVRALFAAAGGRELNIMFPMVAEVDEFVEARKLVERELARLDKLNKPRPSTLRLGTMLEVPSLAWQLPALLEIVDFVSIGSNDLLQFFFASDRGNPQLATRYDFLSPSVLKFLRFVVLQCRGQDVPIGLCGEMARWPLEAMALVGLGLRVISVPPAAVGPIKMMVRSLDAGHLEQFMEGLYDRRDRSVRDILSSYAEEQGIVVN